MERGRGAAVTTFFIDAPLTAATSVVLPASAAHHARVRRMSTGDEVVLTDGAGTLAMGTISRLERSSIDVEVQSARMEPPMTPLELYAPVGDRDRMLWLAEKASELGVTAWRPIVFRRSLSVTPRGEGAAFEAKVRARMIGALEQSGGAWLPVTHPVTDVASAAQDTAMPARYLLDPGGSGLDPTHAASGAAIILGPEGGIEDDERDALTAGGWQPASLARTVLRFETAGVAALGILRAAHLPAVHAPQGGPA